MNRTAIVLAALLVFGIGVATVMLGWNLILTLPTMEKRGGGGAWYITWAMVWITMLCSVVLGGFLLSSTARKK